MVVLRSTTDCAAVSSRRSSARDTVISRLPVGVTAGVVLVSVSSVSMATVRSPAWGRHHRVAAPRPFDFRLAEASCANRIFVGNKAASLQWFLVARASEKQSERETYNPSPPRLRLKCGLRADPLRGHGLSGRTGNRKRVAALPHGRESRRVNRTRQATLPTSPQLRRRAVARAWGQEWIAGLTRSIQRPGAGDAFPQACAGQRIIRTCASLTLRSLRFCFVLSWSCTRALRHHRGSNRPRRR